MALLASVAWLGALGGAAAVRARPMAWPVSVQSAAGLVYVTASFVCHQRPERSFDFEGTPLPVCARCLGLYVGAALGLLFAAGWLVSDGRSQLAQSWVESDPGARLPLLLAAMPTAASVGLEWLGGPSPLWARAVTALPLGAGVAILMAVALPAAGDTRSEPAGSRPSATLP